MTRFSNPGDPGFKEAADLLEEGIRSEAYTAAALLAGRGDDIAWETTAGFARPDSLFDIASVTKPLTAALFFILCQEGSLSPDGLVSTILPFASPDPRTREIRFIHLLSHTSGLPAWLPLYKKLMEEERMAGTMLHGTSEGYDMILSEVLSLPLESDPASAWEYSDLGYMILGRAIEAAGFRSLDRLLEKLLIRPLGMTDTGYLPCAPRDQDYAPRVIPTGWSEERQREKAGEVDDENAAAMGGVAGHAGVFSTTGDLFLFARELLRALRGEGRVLAKASATAMATRVPAPPGCPRTAGFDTPTAGKDGPSQAGALAPKDAIGHLGYTGCSLWIDPASEITVILLTNRVVHGSGNRKLSELRPRIHDAVWKGMGLSL
ncbi:MAG: beta-lactamase family protein [Syntrophorhabdaceae bacterium]|nr:beta-lactamase family protein [Syntrophorhabdaceae bacterium]